MPLSTNSPLFLGSYCRILKSYNNIYFLNKDHCLKISVPKGVFLKKKINFIYTSFLKSSMSPALPSFYSCLRHSLRGLFFPYLFLIHLKGIGFKVKISESNLVFNLGYSHSIPVVLPPYISLKLVKNTQLFLTSPSKNFVSSFSMRLCKLKKKDPYKGKGLILDGKEPLLKVGKRA